MASRESEMAARDLCWNCQSEPGGEFFCESCVKIQPVSKDADYFTCLGLHRILNLDPEGLERRFHELSRKMHPDYFQQKSDEEQAISLANAAVLNTAYRTLRDPIQRVEYLIRLEEGSAKTIPTKAPVDLFDEILEIQETLEGYKHARDKNGPEKIDLERRLGTEKDHLDSRKKSLEEELFALFKAWDQIHESRLPTEKQNLLTDMKAILAQRSYLETVIGGIRNELKEGQEAHG